MASIHGIIRMCRDAAGLQAYMNEREENNKRHKIEQRRAEAMLFGVEPEFDQTMNQFQQPKALILQDLPSTFSFSKFLSPYPASKYRTPKYVTMSLNGPVLDPTHLILCALNEECRMLKRGCFYHLPLRRGISVAHPADLVFVDKEWTDDDTVSWDWLSWEERLAMYQAEGKIQDHEPVIPISCRIFKMSMPANTRGYQMNNLCASNSDPTVKKHEHVFAWSQPLENKSGILIAYPNHHSSPFMCPVDTAEAAAGCFELATPGDLSLTFVPNRQLRPATVFGRRVGEGETAGHNQNSSLLDFAFRDNREIILSLLYIWAQGPIPNVHDHLSFEKVAAWKDMLGSARVFWHQLEHVYKVHREQEYKKMLEVWPGEYGT